MFMMMTQTYQPLPLHRLESGAGYLRPKQQPVGHVTAADPALWVMTDLGQVTTYTTELSTPLGSATSHAKGRSSATPAARFASTQPSTS